ncbi:MAG: hypothetical protein GEU80_07810 [Dehalococcoidia bacterium]|nr:hypothetical protein [Dehalococcoidia bacterium]
MKVLLVPNQRRAGVGKPPATENRRAWLPQQARFCPVLEDGSKTGYLVYPPLHDHEGFQVRYLPQNVFRFTFFVEDATGQAHRAFIVDLHPSSGTGGFDEQEVVFLDEQAPLDQAGALAMVDALTTNVNSPPGGVGLRGAFDFLTPEGWDTIFTGVLNEQQRPHLPSLTVRVETDWYPQNTEFRYILQPGDVISAGGSGPIGQVLFVPREAVEVGDAAAADIERFRDAQRAYWEERATKHHTTNFGALYTYHYRDLQKVWREETAHGAAGAPPATQAPSSAGNERGSSEA